jgi:hypothetical protein
MPIKVKLGSREKKNGTKKSSEKIKEQQNQPQNSASSDEIKIPIPPEPEEQSNPVAEIKREIETTPSVTPTDRVETENRETISAREEPSRVDEVYEDESKNEKSDDSNNFMLIATVLVASLALVGFFLWRHFKAEPKEPSNIDRVVEHRQKAPKDENPTNQIEPKEHQNIKRAKSSSSSNPPATESQTQPQPEEPHDGAENLQMPESQKRVTTPSRDLEAKPQKEKRVRAVEPERSREEETPQDMKSSQETPQIGSRVKMRSNLDERTDDQPESRSLGVDDL